MGNNFISIDDATTFEEIADCRSQHYLISKANKFNFSDLLTGIYEDRTHFIYELIQNAEDANAQEVRIQLYKDSIVFSHDGDKLFDLDDIKSITGIADSNKATNEQKIGKFGIGFKAIFAVCDSPKIYSGDYAFEINNLYVPKTIEKEDVSDSTRFVLPFKDDIDHDKIYKEIKESLKSISSDKLLFLSRITRIHWAVEGSAGHIERVVTRHTIDNERYSILSIEKNGLLLEKFLQFTERLSFNTELEICLLYRLDPEKDEIALQLDNAKTKLHVFFPTKVSTGTKLIVHGPYKTTHTREQVLLSEQINQDIFKETLALYRKSLLVIKKVGQFSLDLLVNLPIGAPDNSWVYSSTGTSFRALQSEYSWYKGFYETTKQTLESEPLLPTRSDEHCLPSEAILARGSDLLSLVDNQQLMEIYGKNLHWLSPDITVDKTPELRNYLMSGLRIREIDFDAFVRDCPNTFFAKQTDDWLMRFYMLAATNIKTIKDKYLEKKFIRLENGDMVSPFTKKAPNAFIPSRVKSGKSIKKTFAQNDPIRLFFEGIGLTTLGVVEQIRDFLEVLVKSPNVSDYQDNLEIIYQEYKNSGDTDKQGIIEAITAKESIWANCVNGSKTVFAKPEKVYLPSRDISTLFEDVDDALIMNKKIYDGFLSTRETGFDESNERLTFLKTIKINDTLKIVKIKDGYPREVKDKYLRGLLRTWDDNEGYQIEFMDEMMRIASKEKSQIVWDFLKKQDSKFFNGHITWHYGMRSGKIDLPSMFVMVLSNKAWIYNHQGEIVRPKDIYYEDAAAIFGENIRLKECIEFKPSIMKSLPEEEQARINITKGIPLDVLEDIVKQYHEQSGETADPILAEPPQGVSAIIDETFSNTRLTTNESTVNHVHNERDGKDSVISDIEEFLGIDLPDNESKHIVKVISNKSERLGKWGERFVYLQLQAKHEKEGYVIAQVNDHIFVATKGSKTVKVTNRNYKEEVQKGYDISIEHNDKVEYIEVKSRQSPFKRSFSVSGTQWEFAKSLERNGKGKNYYVYLVSKAGTKDASIHVYDNPYGNWLKGNLDAHPIAIKL
jgi:hypothetical protein